MRAQKKLKVQSNMPKLLIIQLMLKLLQPRLLLQWTNQKHYWLNQLLKFLPLIFHRTLKMSNLVQMSLYTNELTTRDLTPTTIMFHLTRWMLPLRQLIPVTLVGKLTRANSLRIIICTIVILMLNLFRSVRNSPPLMKLRHKRKPLTKLKKRAKLSDKALILIRSMPLQLNTSKSMAKLTISLIVRFQSLMIGEILVAMTSLD